jgi:transglutaminase-like putative cysteine protease
VIWNKKYEVSDKVREMLIHAGYEMIFDLPQPVAMQLLLQFHPSRESDVVQQERTVAANGESLQVQKYSDSFGNRCERILAPAGRLRLAGDALVEDSGLPDLEMPEAVQHPIKELPPEVMPFLLSSRYCEVDKLSPIAWELFESTPEGWPRVQAVCDWVHSKITFGYHHARWTKSAHDVFIERTGVCRDFTHLAVSFCRCLNIPARYATGYLGDIGVQPLPHPMDFSGWFEVFLGGQWWTFDARHNQRRIGRLLMATGRDAADVALTTSFGSAPLVGFRVWTEEVKPDGAAE